MIPFAGRFLLHGKNVSLGDVYPLLFDFPGLRGSLVSFRLFLATRKVIIIAIIIMRSNARVSHTCHGITSTKIAPVVVVCKRENRPFTNSPVCE